MRRYTGLRWALVVVAGLLGGAAAADTIYLKDGRELSGKVVERKKGFIILQFDSAEVTLPESVVDRIESEPEGALLLKKCRNLAEKGKFHEALAVCVAAEKAGCDPRAGAELRATLESECRRVCLEKKMMKPEARKHYVDAQIMLDRGMLLEASDEIAVACGVDPGNFFLMRELLDLDYALFLRGEIPLSSLQKRAAGVLALEPNDPEAKRIAQHAQMHEYNWEADRKRQVDLLYDRIMTSYEKGARTQAMLSDSKRLRSLQPDTATLIQLGELEKEISPIVQAQFLRKKDQEEKAAATLAMRKAKQKMQEKKQKEVQKKNVILNKAGKGGKGTKAGSI